MKTIVITGASSGIGLTSVKSCLAKGYNVIACARRDEDIAMLKNLGAAAVNLELNDESSVNTAALNILSLSGGSIHTLFNNAGYGLQIAMEDSTWAALNEQHSSNVIGPIMLTNQLLPALSQGSKLIFTGSILGLITIAFRGPYCMSKYALEAATDAYRLELEPLGIGVHIIEPGPIEANFRQRSQSTLESTLNGKKTRLDYSNHWARLIQSGNTPGTLPAQSCADILVAIIEGKKRKQRYRVTRIAKQAALAKRLLGSGFHRVAKNSEPIKEN